MVRKTFIFHPRDDTVIEKVFNDKYYFDNSEKIYIDLKNNEYSSWERSGINIRTYKFFYKKFWENQLSRVKDKIKEIEWDNKKIFIINIFKNIYYSFTFDILLEENIITDYGKLIYKEIKISCPICLEELFINNDYNHDNEYDYDTDNINKIKKNNLKKLKNLFNTNIIKTPCGHCFHKECLLKWKKNNCPLCRHSFEKKIIYNEIEKQNNEDTITAYLN